MKNELTQQDFIHRECQRWQEGRWQSQEQAIAVGISRWHKYQQTGEIPPEMAKNGLQDDKTSKVGKKVVKIKS